MAPTRIPIQQRPQALPEDRQRKEGPGWRRSVPDITGPSYEVPKFNTAAQSERSKQAEHTSARSSGKTDNVRTVDRASLALPYAYSDEDEAKLGVSVP